ncbi:MAG: hypothetical protein OWR52_10445 [Acidibacillus sp.]|uniref:Uncharacterized protein n=1 Tax=Sulfoacidibacillus ferrooxidans TaxID=2005001 RepID=A0A9X2AAV5_9BACL|nr:hypothetical protein [Sulfoacidibacillus ferrooxidans]MCI0182273.1 hypothetical protein [Sulfoacidibacillus ferrooxidans]MCY0893913.1 hypothetical protein [Acidibacillus sp.]
MDMTNNPSPLILHYFYVSLLWQLPIFIAVIVILFFVITLRKHQPVRSLVKEGWIPSEQLTDPLDREVFYRRRTLRVGLGLLWVLDGLLQAQPDMSSEFIPNIVNPSISSLPPFLYNLVEPLVVLWSQSPVQFDILAIWIQVGIGILLLFGGNSGLIRLTLWFSILWGMAVWVIGEDFGGVFSNGATWLAGDPGSVLFYMIGAAFLLLPAKRWREQYVLKYLQRIMAILWMWSAIVQAIPAFGFWSPQGLSSTTLSMAEMPQPASLVAILYAIVHVLSAHPVLWNAIFIIWMGTLGIAWLWQSKLPFVVPITLVWIALTWVIGQDFGVLGGLGTDPNSSPVVFLLILSVVMKSKRKWQPANHV